jgi:hypothetical protein
MTTVLNLFSRLRGVPAAMALALVLMVGATYNTLAVDPIIDPLTAAVSGFAASLEAVIGPAVSIGAVLLLAPLGWRFIKKFAH